MKRRKAISILCVGITLAGQLAPAWLLAQETPRTDPTAAAPGSALLPPATRPAVAQAATTQPAAVSPAATRPAAPQTIADRFPTLRGTDGFWRLGQEPAGAWWFVSPKGDAEFLNTVTTVQPSLKGRQQNGADYISSDYRPVAATAGDEARELDRWAEATLRRVREVGFKGLGAWSHPVLHKFDVPMTRDLNVWTWLRERTVRLYSPEWAAVAEATIRTQVDPLRDNRNLVGYYTDNELDWGDGSVGPGVYFDGLTPADPNRARVTQVIRQTWPTLAAFNADWNAQLVDWSDVDAWPTLPREPSDAYRKLGSAWLTTLAGDYFRVTTALVRKHDPNHLVLGVRYRGFIPPEVVAAARPHTDAQSVNYYVSDAALDQKMFQQAYELSGQPLIVTEYSFHSLDGRSGDRNTVGFPAQVLDQQARAEAYKLFTTRTARVPYIVGADWFQWMDEPPSGRRDDGEDVNFGVVDVDDRPYEQLAAAIKETTPLLNALHGQSPTDARADVWREPTGGKPTVKIPYLATAPRLNGELSDWPAAARLANVKTVRTVGSDRIRTAPPAMLVGWRDEGLYVGFEVFDTHVAAAPADGWWWAKDSIEFWVSTKPPAADQASYDSACHHFYFVPVDFPNRDGVSGQVGQWYAPGSAIRATLMPHPEARSAVRVLADRYVVEIFLPAKALTGYDPAGGRNVMAFNASVRNFEVAAEYYWSAPKLAVTQARPNTWGTVYLEPKPQPTAPIAGGLDATNSPIGQ
jgi:hypothetical protein